MFGLFIVFKMQSKMQLQGIWVFLLLIVEGISGIIQTQYGPCQYQIYHHRYYLFMFGYSRIEHRTYQRPITYISQARTGLVPRDNPEDYHPAMDMETVNALTLLKNQEMRNIVDMGGLDYGICFQDLIVQRLRFKNSRGDSNEKREYIIRQLKDKHQSFDYFKPYSVKQSGSCFICYDYDELQDQLARICAQKRQIKTVYKHIANIAGQ